MEVLIEQLFKKENWQKKHDRSQYAIVVVISIVLQIFGYFAVGNDFIPLIIMGVGAIILGIILGIQNAINRLNDLGQPGSLILITFIPIINIFLSTSPN